ncbi:hypothetical protein D3C71_1439970 [compost metagenome]
MLRRALDRVGQLRRALPNRGAKAAALGLGQRQFADQLLRARQQPGQVPHPLLHVAVLRHGMQPVPVAAAQAIQQQVAIAQTRKASRLGPRLGQPGRHAHVLAAVAQHLGADADHLRPVGLFDVDDPIALVQMRIVLAAGFADGVELGREHHVGATRRIARDGLQQCVDIAHIGLVEWQDRGRPACG